MAEHLTDLSPSASVAAGPRRYSRAGRPSALPDKRESILALIRVGVSPVVAATSLGVPRTTFIGWMNAGFATEVEQAEAECESSIASLAVARIRTTTDALNFLARRFGERWRETMDLRVDVRREAERIAAETGLDADAILSEAEAILVRASAER